MQTSEKLLNNRTRRRSNHAKATQPVSLVYVHDTMQGITRITAGGIFRYIYKNNPVTDEKVLQRIKSLVIPPAWRNVWICPKPNGHIQATGIDAANRKQYRYHPTWNLLSNHNKFSNLFHFGKTLPVIRQRINKDLLLPALCQNKVLAAAVSIMQHTCIRVGNNMYEKLYGSFGLTTLKDRHVKIEGTKVQFSFKGKKGISHTLALKSKRLARIVKQCRDIPGKELFQYYDDKGVRHSIDSGMVNNYIKEISGENFTAKDFRTWAGTLQCFIAFREFGVPPETESEIKLKTVEAIDIVAKHLGNTRAVCKKYYIHPSVLTCYADKTLNKYQLDDCNIDSELSKEEAELMLLLKKTTLAIDI